MSHAIDRQAYRHKIVFLHHRFLSARSAALVSACRKESMMQEDDFVTIRLAVNGVTHHLVVEPRRLLADVLREDLGLTGTNIGCEHGVCGSCTVLVDGQSVRSCLMFAVQANGHEVMTVEGLASGSELHPLQQAFWEKQGLQCGFCTPGFLMTAYELLQRNLNPSEEE